MTTESLEVTLKGGVNENHADIECQKNGLRICMHHTGATEYISITVGDE